MAKYGRIVDEYRLQFVPTVFSRTGQTHGVFKRLIKEQVRQKLICFEDQTTKQSKIRSVMKWWSKRLSMVIAKSASRNVAFKAAKISDTVLVGQSAVLIAYVKVKEEASIDEAVLKDLD